MNYPKLDAADFERAVTAIWYVGMHNSDSQCWIYQKARLEGLHLLYATGGVTEYLALLVKIVECIILQLECDEDLDSQDFFIDQIMDTDIYHSMNMIKSHQALLATLEDSNEAQVLREKLDNDFMLMEEMKVRLTKFIIAGGRQYTDEISIEEKTRIVCDRLDRARSSMEIVEIK